MSSLRDLEKQLESLTRGEKAQLLQWVARDLGDAFPGIESTPGICGGEPCIVPARGFRYGSLSNPGGRGCPKPIHTARVGLAFVGSLRRRNSPTIGAASPEFRE